MAVRQQNYITEARLAAKQIWDGLNTLKGLQREWAALDYGTTLAAGAVGGTNEGILAADVGAVVNTTANAVSALFDTGHATNIAKIL